MISGKDLLNTDDHSNRIQHVSSVSAELPRKLDIRSPQRTNPNVFGDHLTFHLEAPQGQNVQVHDRISLKQQDFNANIVCLTSCA